MVEPLEYNSGLSLEEAREKYKEVKQAFEQIEAFYHVHLDQKLNITDKHHKTLINCTGALLPLTMEDTVQQEIHKKPFEDTLFYEASELNWQIMCYLSNFANTGVERVNFLEL